jgi:hypothetical protein
MDNTCGFEQVSVPKCVAWVRTGQCWRNVYIQLAASVMKLCTVHRRNASLADSDGRCSQHAFCIARCTAFLRDKGRDDSEDQEIEQQKSISDSTPAAIGNDRSHEVAFWRVYAPPGTLAPEGAPRFSPSPR